MQRQKATNHKKALEQQISQLRKSESELSQLAQMIEEISFIKDEIDQGINALSSS